MKYLLKLRKASFHRYPVGQNFAKCSLSVTVFEIQAFLCFAIFANNSKIQNGRLPDQCLYKVSMYTTLWFLRYRQDFQTQSHYGKAERHTLYTCTPGRYFSKLQLPAPYGFSDIPQTRFSLPRSLQQSQMSNQ